VSCSLTIGLHLEKRIKTLFVEAKDAIHIFLSSKFSCSCSLDLSSINKTVQPFIRSPIALIFVSIQIAEINEQQMASKACLITIALFAISVVPIAAAGVQCESKMQKTDLGGELANY
jgi:hypothetical protein